MCEGKYLFTQTAKVVAPGLLGYCSTLIADPGKTVVTLDPLWLLYARCNCVVAWPHLLQLQLLSGKLIIHWRTASQAVASK